MTRDRRGALPQPTEGGAGGREGCFWDQRFDSLLSDVSYSQRSGKGVSAMQIDTGI